MQQSDVARKAVLGFRTHDAIIVQYMPIHRFGRTGFTWGFTLIELIIAIVIAVITTVIAIPRAASFLDAIDVRGATTDAEALFASARQLALTRGERTTVEIDTASATFTLRAGPDIIRHRDEHALHHVKIGATRATVIYAPNGAGFGASNVTITVTKGSVAESLFVSRLGRVRR